MARIALLTAHAIPAAGTENNTAIAGLANIGQLELFASFVRGSGGTTCKAYVQTSLDGGSTWIDIACFAFATTTASKMSNVNAGAPLASASVGTDGALADDTVFEGVIGDQLRVKLVVVGTYAASTISIYAQSKSDVGTGGKSVAGMTSQPDNAQVTLTTGASTAIVAAAAAGTNSRRTLIRCLTSDWYAAEGAPASTSKFLVKAGEAFTSSSLLAINGWPVTGSPTVYVISEAR